MLNPDDLQLLRRVIGDHDPALQQVEARVSALGFEANGRLKSHQTLIDKLKNGLELDRIRDIGGTRVVLQTGTLAAQREATERIQVLWPASHLVDRIARPAYGYRALHLDVKEDGCSIEIQIRSQLQHEWAEACEKLADHWGRQIRYGGPPDEPTKMFRGHSRGDLVKMFRESSRVITLVEEIDLDLEKIGTHHRAIREMHSTVVQGSLPPAHRRKIEVEMTIISTKAEELLASVEGRIAEVKDATSGKLDVLTVLKDMDLTTDSESDDAQ